VPTVRQALTLSGLPAHSLEFELTESVLLDDADQAARWLRELKDTGARVSIDDFGVGYSSLSYLRQLPIDYLKIDRSFVRDVPHDADAAALATAIAAMAHSLKLGVIAEGVENRGQAKFLRSIDCHLMQGYLFEAPLTAYDCERLLASDILRLAGHNPHTSVRHNTPANGS
jgi:EAL domain-containing protein (putative c-di-GMP-specific phosphodiesterase class I)